MSARPDLSRGRPVASALAAATAWLIEPVEPAPPELERTPLEARPVVAVVGLAERCGATTVARALAAELAARDPAGACAVTSTGAGGAIPLGLPAASRLARVLSAPAHASARSCGRLCLVESADRAGLADAARYLAPLVLDVEDTADAAAAAALSDRVLLVASPATEPALAALIGESLRRTGPDPIAVLNRPGPDPERWAGRATIEFPESRLGARLALAGREPGGRLGRAVAQLADRCEGWS